MIARPLDASQCYSETRRFHRFGLLAWTLFKENFQEVGVFPGFTRGFHYDNRYSYIGQSKNRNFSKQLGVSKNISIDSGVIIFDDLTKVSRTIHLRIQLQKYMAFVPWPVINLPRCRKSGIDRTWVRSTCMCVLLGS